MLLKSLEDIRKEFSTQKKCEDYLKKMRWPHGVTCPFCGAKHPLFMSDYRRWQCRNCKSQFTLTSKTIFHGTRLPLAKWFQAVWLICYSPKGISAKQLQREIGVTYKIAWRIQKQIQKAMKHNVFANALCGIVEIDETEVKTDGDDNNLNRSTVLGLFERDGFLRMQVIEDYKAATIDRVCAKNFGTVQAIYTDGAHWLRFLSKYGEHAFVKHYKQFVSKDVHTNNIESVWSLLKRGVTGIFHHISAKHLQAYLDEFSFRFSYRKNKAIMFDMVLRAC